MRCNNLPHYNFIPFHFSSHFQTSLLIFYFFQKSKHDCNIISWRMPHTMGQKNRKDFFCTLLLLTSLNKSIPLSTEGLQVMFVLCKQKKKQSGSILLSINSPQLSTHFLRHLSKFPRRNESKKKNTTIEQAEMPEARLTRHTSDNFIYF